MATLALVALALVALATPARGGLPHFRRGSATVSAPRPSSANCTWRYITQQLDHFAPGAAPAPTQSGSAFTRLRHSPNSSSSSSSRSSSSSDPIFSTPATSRRSRVSTALVSCGARAAVRRAPRLRRAPLLASLYRHQRRRKRLAYCTSAQSR